MPLLNFKQQFVEPIQSGRKHHTIRATRKVPVKPGDSLYLYTGLRHKGAYRILPQPVTCSRVESIEINAKTTGMVTLCGVPLDYTERECLAVADGFRDWDEMLAFWEGRLPFTGQIIHWKSLAVRP
jgi:hypothetical protein